MNYPIGLFATHLELQFRNIALLIEGLQNSSLLCNYLFILEHCMRSARCVLGSWQTRAMEHLFHPPFQTFTRSPVRVKWCEFLPFNRIGQ